MDRRDAEGGTRREVLAASTAQGAGPGHADHQQRATSQAGSAEWLVAAFVEPFDRQHRWDRNMMIAKEERSQ
jgi:hypothetical protein